MSAFAKCEISGPGAEALFVLGLTVSIADLVGGLALALAAFYRRRRD